MPKKQQPPGPPLDYFKSLVKTSTVTVNTAPPAKDRKIGVRENDFLKREIRRQYLRDRELAKEATEDEDE